MRTLLLSFTIQVLLWHTYVWSWQVQNLNYLKKKSIYVFSGMTTADWLYVERPFFRLECLLRPEGLVGTQERCIQISTRCWSQFTNMKLIFQFSCIEIHSCRKYQTPFYLQQKFSLGTQFSLSINCQYLTIPRRFHKFP